MTITSLHMPGNENIIPRIVIFGVGGAGCNAVNNMIGKDLKGVEFVVANTDAQSLATSQANTKIQLGASLTQGLGAGSDPQVGLEAAKESEEDILEFLHGAHMCFITAGMGGGTGTGAAPFVAKIARENGILTVGVVTKPFFFEGERRMDVAKQGVEELEKAVHTLIVVPNENLFQLANEKTTTKEAFMKADDVLYQGVKGVTDLMVHPGLINLDFADVKSVMLETGTAMMGSGEAEGSDRGSKAALLAMSNRLLEDSCLKAARGVLINIIGGQDLTLFDLSEAADTIREGVSTTARVIVGSSLEPDLEGKVRVSLFATGLNSLDRVGDEEFFSDAFTAETSNSSANGTGTAAEVTEEETDDSGSHWTWPEDSRPSGQGMESFGAEGAREADEPYAVSGEEEGTCSNLFFAPKSSSQPAKEPVSEPNWSGQENGGSNGVQSEERTHGIKVAIRRMSEHYENDHPGTDTYPGEPRLKSPTSEIRNSQNGETEEDWRVPAFARRQANWFRGLGRPEKTSA